MDNTKEITFMDRLRANKKKLNIILRQQDRNNDRQIQEIYELKKKHNKEKTDFARKIKCCQRYRLIGRNTRKKKLRLFAHKLTC